MQGPQIWNKLDDSLKKVRSFSKFKKKIKGPVQSKSMFISIDQLPKMIEFHTIIVHNYSSVDFILIFEGVDLMIAAILKNL